MYTVYVACASACRLFPSIFAITFYQEVCIRYAVGRAPGGFNVERDTSPAPHLSDSLYIHIHSAVSRDSEVVIVDSAVHAAFSNVTLNDAAHLLQRDVGPVGGKRDCGLVHRSSLLRVQMAEQREDPVFI